MPANETIARWGNEEFVALLEAGKTEVLPIAKWIAEHLSGAYSVLHNEKLIQPRLQVSVLVVEGIVGESRHWLSRVQEFLMTATRQFF